MFGLTFLDISAGLGLAATGVLTLNMLMGMMLGTGYKRSVYWKKMPAFIQKQDVNQLHNWTAYIALLLVILHPLALFLDKDQKFTLSVLFFPLTAPKQPNIVLLGSLSALAILIVIITTQKIIKKSMSFRAWKNIHLISYATACLFLFHGLLMDPELKGRTTDWLDAEKFFSEFCLLLLIAATIVRYRYYKNSKQVSMVKK